MEKRTLRHLVIREIRTIIRRNLSFPTRFSGEPRMEHGLNTERESALMALEKEEITEQISSRLHLKGLFWKSVFHPCSIRGSPENLVGNERFPLIVIHCSLHIAHCSFWRKIPRQQVQGPNAWPIAMEALHEPRSIRREPDHFSP